MHCFAEILESPDSKNISLNQLAVLNCKAKGNKVFWKINGASGEQNSTYWTIYPVQILNKTALIHGAKLEVLGTSESNNTTVECVVNHSGSIDRSKKALILVQGDLIVDVLYA